MPSYTSNGMNLYHGIKAKYGRKYLWLDLFALVAQMRQPDTIIRIRYFTTIVAGEPEAARRQEIGPPDSAAPVRSRLPRPPARWCLTGSARHQAGRARTQRGRTARHCVHPCRVPARDDQPGYRRSARLHSSSQALSRMNLQQCSFNHDVASQGPCSSDQACCFNSRRMCSRQH